MRLEDLQYIGNQQCYLCRLADQGAQGAVWPIIPRHNPEPVQVNLNEPTEWSLGIFFLYVDIQNAPNVALKSSKKNRDICMHHYGQMLSDWEYIVRIEIEEYNVWQAWLERVEDGRH